MYQPPYFTKENHQEVLDFMHKNPFVTLIGFDGIFPVATQVPVQIDVRENIVYLIGHMMTKTDHFEAYSRYTNVMAMFQGAHTYVSASVYKDPASASTWNYMTVQAKGKIRMFTPEETYQVIKNLTNQYEDPASSPAAFHKMSEDYIQRNLKAITGFELKVTDLKHVFKLSQNHPQENRDAIIKDLKERADPMSAEVAKNMN
ncbi:FMN-binding negative transcriptional regulator [Pedobacter sp. PWIIR3]